MIPIKLDISLPKLPSPLVYNLLLYSNADIPSSLSVIINGGS
jgi:hypothetical protein